MRNLQTVKQKQKKPNTVFGEAFKILVHNKYYMMITVTYILQQFYENDDRCWNILCKICSRQMRICSAHLRGLSIFLDYRL